MLRTAIETCTHATAPVPATAGDADIIAPDNFARIRVFDNRLTFFQGIKRFITFGKRQTRCACISGKVLTPTGMA